jgi:hypothetical protein
MRQFGYFSLRILTPGAQIDFAGDLPHMDDPGETVLLTISLTHLLKAVYV